MLRMTGNRMMVLGAGRIAPSSSSLAIPQSASSSSLVATRESSTKIKRPTSPHLMIYRLPLCANLSFITRATGMGMTLGLSGMGLYALQNPDITPFFEFLRETPHDELRGHYGKRWDSLVQCLQAKCPKVALVNKYAPVDYSEVFSIERCLSVSGYDETHKSSDEIKQVIHSSLPPVRNIIVRQVGSGEETAQDSFTQPLSFYTSCWTDDIPTSYEGQFPAPRPDSNGILPYFLLDMVSLAPVLALNVLPTHDVLDMCAAPGGKMLAIAQLLTPMGSLTANEASKERGKRLNQVIQTYLSGSPLFEEKKIFLSTRDATRWFAPSKYDRVLLNVPCSAERHLFQMSQKESKKDADRLWASSKTLTNTQISMLIQAIETVKTSGRVVYSTSSLSPMENDFVVAKVLKRFANHGAFELCVVSKPSGRNFTPPFPMLAEPTKFGWIYLPDKVSTMKVGPIYLAVLVKKEKVAEENSTEEEDDDEEVSSLCSSI